MLFKHYLAYSFIIFNLFSSIVYSLLSIRGIHYVSFALLFLTIVAIGQDKRFLLVVKTKPVAIWLIWVVYAFFNWRSKGIFPMESQFSFVLMKFVLPVGMMLIVYYEGLIDKKRTTMVLLFTLISYVLIGILFQDAGSGNGVDWEARGGMLLGNKLALNAFSLSFVSVAYCVSYEVKKNFLYLCLGVALAGIVFTATRKAIAAWGIVVVFYMMSTLNLKNSKTLFRFALSIIILVGLTFFLLNNTMFGERFSSVEEQSEAALANYAETPQFLNFLGDRALHYMLGWELFLKNPITGIGLYNFMEVANFPVPLHTEYITQLCECGIIGFTLYVFFMYSLFDIVWHTYKYRNRRVAIVCMGGLFAILFIGLTGWTYEGTHYFADYGLILSSCSGAALSFKKTV